MPKTTAGLEKKNRQGEFVSFPRSQLASSANPRARILVCLLICRPSCRHVEVGACNFKCQGRSETERERQKESCVRGEAPVVPVAVVVVVVGGGGGEGWTEMKRERKP